MAVQKVQFKCKNLKVLIFIVLELKRHLFWIYLSSNFLEICAIKPLTFARVGRWFLDTISQTVKLELNNQKHIKFQLEIPEDGSQINIRQMLICTVGSWGIWNSDFKRNSV